MNSHATPTLPTPTMRLWGRQIYPSEVARTTDHCAAFTLPSNGVIRLPNSAITLTTNVVFQPQCTGTPPQQISTDTGFEFPFYASAIPQVYVIAASTVVAWVLLVMLMITARTGFTGTAGAPVGFGSGRGIIGGATGRTSIVGVGSRPWLQKVATFTVALGLALASADMLREAAIQYGEGYQNAKMLRDAVLATLEIRIMRLVSDIFLWLAQVQTLVRLFPRHKEKVLIKWIGFGLILCDTVFACLNVALTDYDEEIHDAIPALLYLFEFALSLLYASWVIYYSITKRRFAFYHNKMRSVSLIALLSFVSILTPVVFFITDISNHDIAGWGDYTRWVGAAAASVVVWEWVERIEALERDERKDGILGRELFDGDEMLDIMPSDDVVWTAPRRQRNQYRRQSRVEDGSEDESSSTSPSKLEKGFSNFATRFRFKRKSGQAQATVADEKESTTQSSTATRQQDSTGNLQGMSISFAALPRPRDQDNASNASDRLTPPPNVASPVSRTDTTSAASTVYVVRYSTVNEIPQRVTLEADANGNTADGIRQLEMQRQRRQSGRLPLRGSNARDAEKETYEGAENEVRLDRDHNSISGPTWLSVANPFKRKRSGLPREVQAAAASHADESLPSRTPVASQNASRWDPRSRMSNFTTGGGNRAANRNAGSSVARVDPPAVMIIPPPARGSGHVWTPDTHLTQTAPADEASTSSPDGAEGTGSTPARSGATRSAASARSIPGFTPSINSRSRTVNAQSTSGSPPPSSRSDGRASATSRASEGVRPESLTPERGTNSPVIIPAPNRGRKTRSPLATHSEAESADD